MNAKYSIENNPEYWFEQANMETLRGWFGPDTQVPGLWPHAQSAYPHDGAAEGYALHIGQYLSVLASRDVASLSWTKTPGRLPGLPVGWVGCVSAKAIIFTRTDLHADETISGTLLTALSDKPDFLVSCGSGTLTDNHAI